MEAQDLPDDIARLSVGDKVFLLSELEVRIGSSSKKYPKQTEGRILEFESSDSGGTEKVYVIVVIDESIMWTPVDDFWTMWHDDSTFWSRLVEEDE